MSDNKRKNDKRKQSDKSKKSHKEVKILKDPTKLIPKRVNLLFFVIFVFNDTSCGNIEDACGTNKTSSNVNPSMTIFEF